MREARRSRGRLLLVATAAAYFLAVAIWIGVDTRSRRSTGGAFSTFNTSPEGCSVALSYLQRARRGVPAAMLTRGIDATEVPRNAVVFRIAPRSAAIEALLSDRARTKKEGDDLPLLSPAEEEWVSGGGRLVVAVTRSIPGVDIDDDATGEVRKVFPLWPSVTALDVPTGRGLRSRDAYAVFTIGDAPLVTHRTVGKGDIVLLAAPEILQNAHIQKKQNAAFLQELASNRPALFDEVIHGVRTDAGLLELMKRWGLGPFVLLLLAAFALRLWRNGTRLGSADPDSVDSRSEAVDLVESMGALYRKALSRNELLELYERSFEQEVAHQSALRGEELQRRVQQLLSREETNEVTNKSSFQRRLNKINEAFRRLERGKRR